MKTAKPKNRRQFLLAAGLGTAGAAAVVATGTGVRPQAPAEPAKPEGYHLSEHILKYYKTTLV
jgi:hypothetical protein